MQFSVMSRALIKGAFNLLQKRSRLTGFFSVGEILLSGYRNRSTNLLGLSFNPISRRDQSFLLPSLGKAAEIVENCTNSRVFCQNYSLDAEKSYLHCSAVHTSSFKFQISNIYMQSLHIFIKPGK